MIDWRSCFAPGTAVMTLPAWGRPRLFVPAGHGCWRAGAHYPATRVPARAVRWAARCLTAIGVPRAATATGLAAPIREAIGRDRRVLALIPGTPGPAMKATLVLGDEAGRATAFLKIGDTPAAIRRLRQEAALLGRLPPSLGPLLLDFREGEGMALVLLAAVPGRPLPWPRDPPPLLRGVIEALHVGLPRPAAEHPWLAEVLEGAGERGRAWRAALGRRAWPGSLRHGDLLYGHVLVAGRAWRLIDWEYGAIEGFPWVDYAHLMLHRAALIGRWDPGRARDHATRRLGQWPGLDAGEAGAIVAIAAFAAERDGAADGHDEGTPLQAWRRAVWRGAP